MLQKIKNIKIVQSFLSLRGNTRTSVIFEPLWGIPFTFYNFYLSLYLKEMGVTDQQFGTILFAGFLSGAFFSLFAGVITDFLGRKKTTFFFDIFAWPVAISVFLISRSLIMFVIATILNNTAKIVMVSWNLMVIEDADTRQRVSAFNLINLVNIAVGIITPLAGLLVATSGIVSAERIFMIFAIVSMITMMLGRNHFYKETKVGQEILHEHRGLRLNEVIKKGLFGGGIQQIVKSPRLAIIVAIQILFNLTLILGAFNSMYFAPYMTEHLGIDKASLSILGTVYAAVMLFIFLIVNPILTKHKASGNMIWGLVIQGMGILLIIFLAKGSLIGAAGAIALYAFGFGIFRPFVDSVFADLSEGKSRAGIYSLVNTVTSVLSALVGYASGYIYAKNPILIFVITAGLIGICLLAVLYLSMHSNKKSHGHHEYI